MSPESNPPTQPANAAAPLPLDYSERPPNLRLILEEIPGGIRIIDPPVRRTSAIIAGVIFVGGMIAWGFSHISNLTKDNTLLYGYLAAAIVLGTGIFLLLMRGLRLSTIITVLPGKFLLDRPILFWSETSEIPLEDLTNLTVFITHRSITLRRMGLLSIGSTKAMHEVFTNHPTDDLLWVARLMLRRAGIPGEVMEMNHPRGVNG
jgi:hypothetical protein